MNRVLFIIKIQDYEIGIELCMAYKQNVRNWLLEHPLFNPYGFSADRAYRNLTSPIRILPNFLIAGFNRSGTHSLFEYMGQHPNILNASRREIHYFTLSYWRGLNWYKSYFPTSIYRNFCEKKTQQKFLTGEATPHYVFHPLAMKRIKELLPNVKLIVVLRNPVENAYSHFQHYKRGGIEKDSFEEAIRTDAQRFEKITYLYNNDLMKEHNLRDVKMPYVSYATYVIHIKRLLEIFPREQILFVKNTELNQNPQEVLDRIFEYLKLQKFTVKDLVKRNVGKYVKINSETEKYLKDYFKPYNKQLEDLLDMKFRWD